IVSPEVPARSSKEGRPRSQNQDKQRIMLARDGGARRAPTDLCMMVIVTMLLETIVEAVTNELMNFVLNSLMDQTRMQIGMLGDLL
ncbi:hypothetical protein PF005_g28319, partial [Phytophthora fragariae]